MRVFFLFSCLFFFLLTETRPAYGFLVLGPQGSTHTLKGMQLVLAQAGKDQTLTCVTDYFGTARKFALVIPVKGKLKKEGFRNINLNTIDQLNYFTAPRWVDFFDRAPCSGNFDLEAYKEWGGPKPDTIDFASINPKKAVGLRPSGRFTVGEAEYFSFNYEQRKKFNQWLTKNGLTLRSDEKEMLKQYESEAYEWAVVKIVLENYVVQERVFIRPFQIQFEQTEIHLPTGLISKMTKSGTPVELYFLTSSGKVIPNNYRLINSVTDKNFPLWTKERWADLHQAVFENANQADGRRAVYLDHYWDWSGHLTEKCDPCVTHPLRNEQLQQLGVNHLYFQDNESYKGMLYVTRMKFLASKPYFDEDISFSIPTNGQLFQIRYYSTVPAMGNTDCPEGRKYLNELKRGKQTENDNLMIYAGWFEDMERFKVKLEVNPESKQLNKP